MSRTRIATPSKPTSGQSASGRSTVRPINRSAIQPRRMDFDFDADIPLYWFANDQFKTLLFTTLSCTFPEGERFFVRSVRQFQKQIKSTLLREQVRGFIGQEAHHGMEHDAFNAFMESKGVPTSKVDAFVREGLAWVEKRYSPARQLAKTAALEHFTAMLAELVLDHDDFLEGMDRRMLPLWLWHAIEESEHKAVAFDVFAEQVGNYWMRSGEMAVTTVEFIGYTIFHYFQLRAGMDDNTDWKSVGNGVRWLVGRRGWLRRLRGSYLAYYMPGFHPSKRDSSEARKRALKRLALMLDRPEQNIA